MKCPERSEIISAINADYMGVPLSTRQKLVIWHSSSYANHDKCGCYHMYEEVSSKFDELLTLREAADVLEKHSFTETSVYVKECLKLLTYRVGRDLTDD